MSELSDKRAELVKLADEAVEKYARREISKQECSEAQRDLIDFDAANGEVGEPNGN
jgi:hypothetical protein